MQNKRHKYLIKCWYEGMNTEHNLHTSIVIDKEQAITTYLALLRKWSNVQNTHGEFKDITTNILLEFWDN